MEMVFSTGALVSLGLIGWNMFPSKLIAAAFALILIQVLTAYDVSLGINAAIIATGIGAVILAERLLGKKS